MKIHVRRISTRQDFWFAIINGELTATADVADEAVKAAAKKMNTDGLFVWSGGRTEGGGMADKMSKVPISEDYAGAITWQLEHDLGLDYRAFIAY